MRHSALLDPTRSLILLALFLFAAPAFGQDEAAIEACFNAYEETQVHLKAQEFEKARELSRQCSQGCPEEISEQCQKWTWQAERDAPSVLLVARLASGEDAPGVQVKVDGQWRPLQKEVLLDPGPHTIEFSREEDDWTQVVEITVHAGEKRRTIRAAIPSDETEETAPSAPVEADNSHVPWAVASYSVGAVGFGIAGAFTLIGLDRKSNLDDCAPNCMQTDVDKARSALTVADVGLVVGIVGAVGGTAILVWGKPKAQSKASVGVAPTAGGFTTVFRSTF